MSRAELTRKAGSGHPGKRVGWPQPGNPPAAERPGQQAAGHGQEHVQDDHAGRDRRVHRQGHRVGQARAALNGEFMLSCVDPARLVHFPLPLQISGPFGPSWMIWAPAGGAVPGLSGVGGAPVTVTSVPTPYSAPSTSVCAFLNPADAEATVTTSPTPSARPSAIKMAWRILRRNSRRTYVTKNIWAQPSTSADGQPCTARAVAAG
jgi:hypothetical protein